MPCRPSSTGPRVAVVGACGAHAAALLRAYQDIGARITHVVDIADGVEEVAAGCGAVPLRDHRELIGLPLEGVSVALPPELHAPVCLDLLQGGLTVLCEKPLAPSGPEAQAFVEAAAQTPGRLMVGFVMRYQPELQALEDCIRSGRLGRVFAVHARKCWRSRSPWRLRKGGGAVFVKDIHYYELIPRLLGSRPTHVYAVGGNFFHGGEVEDAYQLLMRFENGAVFHLDSAWWSLRSSASAFEVVGDKAGVRLLDGRLIWENGEVQEIPVAGEDMLRAQLRAFLEFAAGKRDPAITLEEAARAHWLAEAVVRSLRTGAVIALDERGRPVGGFEEPGTPARP